MRDGGQIDLNCEMHVYSRLVAHVHIFGQPGIITVDHLRFRGILIIFQIRFSDPFWNISCRVRDLLHGRDLYHGIPCRALVFPDHTPSIRSLNGLETFCCRISMSTSFRTIYSENVCRDAITVCGALVIILATSRR